MRAQPIPCVTDRHLHTVVAWFRPLIPTVSIYLPQLAYHSVLASPLQVAPEAVDAMVAELNSKEAKSKAFSRRRAFRLDADVDYINPRNAHFNKKIQRAFGKHTEEVRANLERGTALPD